jgi:hypothetical protein
MKEMSNTVYVDRRISRHTWVWVDVLPWTVVGIWGPVLSVLFLFFTDGRKREPIRMEPDEKTNHHRAVSREKGLFRTSLIHCLFYVIP